MIGRGALRLGRILGIVGQVEAAERRAVLLGFSAYLLLLACAYLLRPLRDTMATVFGVDQLQLLFTLTFVSTLVFSPLFAWLTTRVRLARLLPGVFAAFALSVLVFYLLFLVAPSSLAVAAAYYTWYSTINLVMISVFWTLMVELFSAAQATRLFAFIAAGGSIGSIIGALVTRSAVAGIGIGGLLLLAAALFGALVWLTLRIIAEKSSLQQHSAEAQASTMDHTLSGSPFDGFAELLKSAFMRNQMWFMMLMTWVNTVAYFVQTDVVARAFSGLEQRTRAIADIDLVVNILSALLLTFGLARFVKRFGVTASLLLNPLMMAVAFLAVALSPSLLIIQAVQVTRRVAQYAIARPAREMCFAVVPQTSRYRAKNVVDTVVYRSGDVIAAWLQAGLRSAGFGLAGTVAFGLACSGLWGASAVALGRQYQRLRGGQPDAIQLH
jgi:ATP:ADP antiporter, AAA family